jgi:hypothetical protein
LHYGNKRDCRASAAHGKDDKTHGKGFVVRFFSKTHGKEHTTANCTVNALCRAVFILTHGKALPCVNFGARQRISKSIKKLPCVEIDAWQTLQKKIKKGKSLPEWLLRPSDRYRKK